MLQWLGQAWAEPLLVMPTTGAGQAWGCMAGLQRCRMGLPLLAERNALNSEGCKIGTAIQKMRWGAFLAACLATEPIEPYLPLVLDGLAATTQADSSLAATAQTEAALPMLQEAAELPPYLRGYHLLRQDNLG